MMLKHPTFGDRITQDVPDADVDRWQASGWVPLLDGDRRPRLDAITTEVAHRCPVCEASGDEPCRTATGNPTSRHKARG